MIRGNSGETTSLANSVLTEYRSGRAPAHGLHNATFHDCTASSGWLPLAPNAAADSAHARPVSQTLASSAVRGTRAPDENERRAALAQDPVPGYAGDLVEGCNYVVLMTD